MKHTWLIAAVVLSGCATMDEVKVPEVVKIPVAVPCPVESPAPPLYQFDTLKPEDSIWTKVKVLLADRQLAIGYERELAAALASCK